MSNILRFALIAVVAAGSAVATAGAVIAFAPQPSELRALRAEAPIAMPAPPPAPVAEAAIAKAADGHFWAEGDVDGTTVRFLVDTGATAVALTPVDAARLGFRQSDLHYGYTVMTAGGATRAAMVKLASVSVAGARVQDVDALVIEKGLDASLLGMTYLGRLSSFEASPQALVLRR